MTRIFAVVNRKGGTGKTTTAAYLMHVLHEMGMRVLGVDADGENESLAEWQVEADWEVPVVGMAVPNLHKQLPGVMGDRYEAVVIDTPPMKEQRGIVLSAARLATHIVVPMAPTPIEFKRLSAVRELVEEAGSLQLDGQVDPVMAVMLNRVSPRAASTKVFRDLSTEAGFTVLKAQINRSERFAQAWGSPIKKAMSTPYADAVEELFDMEEVAA